VRDYNSVYQSVVKNLSIYILTKYQYSCIYNRLKPISGNSFQLFMWVAFNEIWESKGVFPFYGVIMIIVWETTVRGTFVFKLSVAQSKQKQPE